MSEPEPIVQIILNIGAEGDLSQAEADALLEELKARVSGQLAGSVDIIDKKSPEESSSKGEPMITLAVAVLQYVVPKLIEVVYDMIKERRNNRIKALAKMGSEQITLDSRTDPVEFQVIQDRIQTTNVGEKVHDRRYALLIGTTHYQDSRLNQLASPEIDIQALADTLRDPTIGAYDDVNLSLNQSSWAILQAVENFFKRKANTDLLLLYFSGHGVRGEQGKLYLATENTNLELLNSTALSSDFIKDAMDSSQSERQVLILDCCYSGSFLNRSKSAKAASVGVPVDATSAFEGNGFGRVVLTATDKTQVAWEGQRVTGQIQKSVFTEHLIEGLKSGEADKDRDGWIGLEELYKYIYNRMVKMTPDQTPEINAFNMKGSIFLARNPRPRPMELPPELQALIDHPDRDVRVTAVNKLNELLDSSQYGLALAARKALEKLAADDSRRVSEAAGKVLGLVPLETEPLEKPRQADTSGLPREIDTRPKPVEPSKPPFRVQPPNPQPQLEETAQPAAWWTKIKPPPGTRSGAGTKAGPNLADEISVSSEDYARPPLAAQPFSNPLVPGYPTLQKPSASTIIPNRTAPAGIMDSFREPDTLALVAGLLSLLLIFLPVSVWGFVTGLQAIKIPPRSPRAVAGFVLSCVALAIQLVIILTLL